MFQGSIYTTTQSFPRITAHITASNRFLNWEEKKERKKKRRKKKEKKNYQKKKTLHSKLIGYRSDPKRASRIMFQNSIWVTHSKGRALFSQST
jgi:hypothetical protein